MIDYAMVLDSIKVNPDFVETAFCGFKSSHWSKELSTLLIEMTKPRVRLHMEAGVPGVPEFISWIKKHHFGNFFRENKLSGRTSFHFTSYFADWIIYHYYKENYSFDMMKPDASMTHILRSLGIHDNNNVLAPDIFLGYHIDDTAKSYMTSQLGLLYTYQSYGLPSSPTTLLSAPIELGLRPAPDMSALTGEGDNFEVKSKSTSEQISTPEKNRNASSIIESLCVTIDEPIPEAA